MPDSDGRQPEVQAAVAITEVRYLREDIAEIKAMLQRMDDRLRRLENWRSYSLGVAAAVGAAVSFVAKAVWDWVRGGTH